MTRPHRRAFPFTCARPSSRECCIFAQAQTTPAAAPVDVTDTIRCPGRSYATRGQGDPETIGDQAQADSRCDARRIRPNGDAQPIAELGDAVHAQSSVRDNGLTNLKRLRGEHPKLVRRARGKESLRSIPKRSMSSRTDSAIDYFRLPRIKRYSPMASSRRSEESVLHVLESPRQGNRRRSAARSSVRRPDRRNRLRTTPARLRPVRRDRQVSEEQRLRPSLGADRRATRHPGARHRTNVRSNRCRRDRVPFSRPARAMCSEFRRPLGRSREARFKRSPSLLFVVRRIPAWRRLAGRHEVTDAALIGGKVPAHTHKSAPHFRSCASISESRTREGPCRSARMR